MCLVPTTDDPFMVAWHVPMVGRSNDVELAIILLHSSAGLPDAMITHEDVDRSEMVDVLRRRWPEAW
jgi:hypothetical protein